MRQIVLDTETTGLESDRGHRIIEIGCVELVSRRITGRRFHRYLNPDRDIDEGAQQVHGISRAQLEHEPRFGEIAAEFLDFVRGAELIAHNAPFDVAFLNAELARLPGDVARIGDQCRILDTLLLARELHPGQRNSLDALCKRYGVDNSQRDLHGALLDAQILADVYLAMTGGQGALALGEERRSERHVAGGPQAVRKAVHPGAPLAVPRASAEEIAAHESMLDRVAKAGGGKCLFRNPLESPGG
jgi:DNA polymerase III subunit epsilon